MVHTTSYFSRVIFCGSLYIYMFSDNRGVTIVELIVTMSIAAVLLSFGIRYLGDIREREEFNTYYDEMVVDLKATQNKARSSIQDSRNGTIIATQVQIESNRYVISNILADGTKEDYLTHSHPSIIFSPIGLEFRFLYPTARLAQTSGALITSQIDIRIRYSGVPHTHEIALLPNGTMIAN